jgi:maltose-binding protein MalE
MRALAWVWVLALFVPACAPSTKTPAGGTRIVIWEQMDPEERARFEQNLESYRASHPDVTVEHVPYETEQLRSQYITAASGGEGPDLVFGPSDQVGPLSLLQLIRPLDRTLPAGFFDRFVPQALDTLDGHLWAAPDQVGNHLVLVYNRKLVPQPPRTHDEFLRTARAQTKDGVYGFAMNLMEPYWLVPFLAGYGGWVMDDGRRPTLDTPAMREALAYLGRLKNEEKIMPGESDYQIAETLFKEGKAAMIVNGPWSWLGYRKAGIDVGVAPIWTLPNGRSASPMTASKGYSINTNVPEDKLPAVIELLTFLTSAEAQLLRATELGILPSHRDAWADPSVQGDPTLRESQRAFELGRRMPVVPEMRVLWDVMRPGMQQVMNRTKTPAAAAAGMQAAAVREIAGMGAPGAKSGPSPSDVEAKPPAGEAGSGAGTEAKPGASR